LRQALKVIGFTIDGMATTSSSALSRDFQAAMHTDNDAFLSNLIVTTQLHDVTLPVTERVRANLEMDSQEPAFHFIFPSLNIAVPMHPSSILIFNPTIPHGCSAKLAAYENSHVNLMSMYLKSAVVGKNDNSIPMTDEAKKVAERIWAAMREAAKARQRMSQKLAAPTSRDEAVLQPVLIQSKTTRRSHSSTAALSATCVNDGGESSSDESFFSESDNDDDDEDYIDATEDRKRKAKSTS
jgi:hypothetical protein